MVLMINFWNYERVTEVPYGGLWNGDKVQEVLNGDEGRYPC